MDKLGFKSLLALVESRPGFLPLPRDSSLKRSRYRDVLVQRSVVIKRSDLTIQLIADRTSRDALIHFFDPGLEVEGIEFSDGSCRVSENTQDRLREFCNAAEDDKEIPHSCRSRSASRCPAAALSQSGHVRQAHRDRLQFRAGRPAQPRHKTQAPPGLPAMSRMWP